MSLAESAVRVYVFYLVGAAALMATSMLVGTVVGEPIALVVGFLVLLCVVFVGLFLHARP